MASPISRVEARASADCHEIVIGATDTSRLWVRVTRIDVRMDECLTESGDMTTDGSNWNAIMQYSFLHVFANDGLIDRDELQMLERLALQDGAVDERERDVLARVFARVNAQTVDPSVLEEINRFKTQ